jgi:NAD-dependent dihydropyrimidine dehydrogenase PreA subunit
MIRTIITIDEEQCTGCGLCVDACHEGAIALVDGKARLFHDDYCDGLGNCLPVCPEGAISFEQREAAAYDEQAVLSARPAVLQSELHQWPIQIKLVPVAAPYFEGAALLIAADCAAYAYANFHTAFMRGRKILVGCPKLDNVDYSDKLSAILTQNDITGVTVVRMEVPCCGGIEYAARTAIDRSGKPILLDVITLSISGEIL